MGAQDILKSRWLYIGLGSLLLLGLMFFSMVDVHIPSRSRGDLDDLRALRDRDDVNVVFILIDTLRADHLSAYGYERRTSPTLEDVANTGIRFANVRAQSSWTKTSMASLWLGAYPQRTGILHHSHAIPEKATMPAELFRDAGYKTIGLFRNGWVSNNFGFSQGFDIYYKPSTSRTAERMSRPNPSAHALLGSDLDLTQSALEFARSYRNQRFFLYLHYMDVHQYVYEADSALFGTDFISSYDNSIHWTDRNINALLAGFDEMDLLTKTVFVITSDHGEAFYEHKAEGHGRDLYQEVVGTPFIVVLPFLLRPGIVVESTVENVDVWPTILDIMGLPPLPDAHGQSLLPLVEVAAAGEEKIETERLGFGHIHVGWGGDEDEARPLVAVSKGPYRLIQMIDMPDRPELYDHSNDPFEQNNLAASKPEVVAELQQALQDYLNAPPTPWSTPDKMQLDEYRLNQLRAIGYAIK